MVTGLRKSGASTSSAAAFFLGNPALNPAVLVFIAMVLGWKWALLRLAMALVLVLGTALLIARFVRAPVTVPHETAAALAGPSGSLVTRWFKSLGRLAIGLIPEYVVLILGLGAARAFLFPAAGQQLGNSVFVVLGLAVVGMLFAIPTAGEIPIISTMRGFGMGAGPAGALLLTLAPISLPSIAMVWRVFPKSALAIMAGAVVVAGVVAGGLAVALQL